MHNLEHRVIQSLVLPILAEPFASGRKWQVQGLGMLRTYISPDVRLHIWDSRLKYCEDSGWHTHPWNFTSYIVSGQIINKLYIERSDDRSYDGWKPFTKQPIICGPGGCARAEPEDVWLNEWASNVYRDGDWYKQSADEIHTTIPADGTVTLIMRHTVNKDGAATVYFPRGSVWSSAEARDASSQEIVAGTALALFGVRDTP